MNAADDKIEAAQHVVRVVERAVRKDIGLDALEDAEAAAERRVEAVDLSLLLLDLLDRKAAGPSWRRVETANAMRSDLENVPLINQQFREGRARRARPLAESTRARVAPQVSRLALMRL